ncbi:MAG TPA: LmeA family phospholipid-binding protein [Anaerolineae bacterium]
MSRGLFGCIGAVLGLVVGVVVAFGIAQFAASSNAEPTRVPVLTAGQSDVSITASAAYINSEFQQSIKQSGLAKQATVTLASPNVMQVAAPVDASAFGFPISVNAKVTLRVLVQRGRIVLAIEKLDAGGIVVAPATFGTAVEKMRASVEDQINRLAQRALQGSNLHVSNVRITPDGLTIDLISQ